MLLAWLALCAFVIVAIGLDLRFGGHGALSPRAAIGWSVLWLALGVGFAGVLALAGDGRGASEYLAGFLIEKSLSLDNLFVFAVLFSFFRVPQSERHRVLLLGIVGAIVLRAGFIFAGAAALDAVHAVTYALGALLAFTAYKIARQSSEEIDPDKTLAMRFVRRLVPISQEYDGAKLMTVENGRRAATPLFAALVMIAAFDVMFAIDSIPAIFAITRDTFIVFAANAFSLLGMVGLYFLLDGMLDRFRYLNVGLAAILGYVAAKLILVDVWHPPIALTLGVVVAALGAAALASWWVERREHREPGPEAGPEPEPAELNRRSDAPPRARR